jgi:hypothetical protein
VSRSVSQTGSLKWDAANITDGFFVLQIPNTYNLLISELDQENLPVSFEYQLDGMTPIMYSSVGDFDEGNVFQFHVPSKKITYTIVSLPGEVSELPSEIQQPGSIALLEGNRLVAVDSNATEATPESLMSNGKTSFTQTVEEVKEQSPEIYSYNNCAGSVDITHQIASTSIQEITDMTGNKFGVELPVTTWLKFVADIEKQYSIKNQEIKNNSIILVVPPGENIEFSVVRRQTWESGIATLNANGVDIVQPYQFLGNEEIVYQQQKLPCP